MRRTTSSGALCAALLGALVGCGDEQICHLDQCGNACVDFGSDSGNCGQCGHSCDTGTSCVQGACVPDALVCTAPEEACGEVCVDTQTAADHCGDCDTACSTNGDCVTGACAEPLALIQTDKDDGSGGTIARDTFVLQDVTFQLTKLNASTFPSARVIDHLVLPDGRIVLAAAEDTEGTVELYLASPRGGALTKLSPALVTGGNVQAGLVASADGSTILYRADEDTDDEIDLYAVHVANPGQAVRVNGALAAGGRVSRVFALTADGKRASYVANQDDVTIDEAYTVDLSTATPGASVKLNPTVLRSLWDLRMSANGARVVYRTDDTPSGIPQLFAVDVATPGTAIPVANTAEPNYRSADDYALTSDGAALIYAGSENFLQESLWRVPLGGATLDSTRIVDGTIVTGVELGFVIAADDKHVVYRHQSGSFVRVFEVDTTAATPAEVPLSSLDDSDQKAQVTDFALSPSGAHLVFRGGADGAEGGFQTPGTEENPFVDTRTAPAIFHVDLAAMTAPVELASSANNGIDGGYLAFDDGRALFRADIDVAGQSDVYLGDAATPGTTRKVSPPLDVTTDATDAFSLSPF